MYRLYVRVDGRWVAIPLLYYSYRHAYDDGATLAPLRVRIVDMHTKKEC